MGTAIGSVTSANIDLTMATVARTHACLVEGHSPVESMVTTAHLLSLHHHGLLVTLSFATCGVQMGTEGNVVLECLTNSVPMWANIRSTTMMTLIVAVEAVECSGKLGKPWDIKASITSRGPFSLNKIAK